jgi:hypothetical protein
MMVARPLVTLAMRFPFTITLVVTGSAACPVYRLAIAAIPPVTRAVCS